jgi:hypothetical protein
MNRATITQERAVCLDDMPTAHARGACPADTRSAPPSATTARQAAMHAYKTHPYPRCSASNHASSAWGCAHLCVCRPYSNSKEAHLKQHVRERPHTLSAYYSWCQEGRLRNAHALIGAMNETVTTIRTRNARVPAMAYTMHTTSSTAYDCNHGITALTATNASRAMLISTCGDTRGMRAPAHGAVRRLRRTQRERERDIPERRRTQHRQDAHTRAPAAADPTVDPNPRSMKATPKMSESTPI